MMKQLLTYLVLMIATNSLGGTIINCQLISSKTDAMLEKNTSLFEFEFREITERKFDVIYSIDGVNWRAKLTKGEKLKVLLTPGKHSFKFYVKDYMEIYTGTLSIKSQYKDHYQLYFTTSLYPVTADKPVIYLYPKEETQVQVSLNVKGTDPFFYPSYTDKWECTAMPNGDLHIKDKVYNYLFWEANLAAVSLDYRTGFMVQKNEAVKFLEEKLNLAGFTSKEQADFITYWAPRMMKHDQCFVHFVFNETCNDFAEISITPKPTNIYRIYLLFQPTETNVETIEQLIAPIDRGGFNVLEWGGMEFPASTNNETF